MAADPSTLTRRLGDRRICHVPTAVPAGVRLVPAAHGIPAYCLVTGSVLTDAATRKTANFGFALPMAWNHRFVFSGCGHYCGQVVQGLPSDAHDGLASGTAVAATDDGHASEPPGEALDASWALKAPGVPNQDAVNDFFYRAVHTVTVSGQQFVKRWYAGTLARSASYAGSGNVNAAASWSCKANPAAPSAPQTLYAVGGAVGNLSGPPAQRSDDGGATWRVVGGGLGNPRYGFDVAVDPTDPRVAYGLFFDSGVWKTADGGEHWTRQLSIPQLFFGKLVIDPRRPRAILVSAGSTDDAFRLFWRSLDAGATWALVHAGLPELVTDLAFGPTGALYAETEDATGYQLFTSSNDGATWQRTASPPTGLTALAILAPPACSPSIRP